MPMKNIKGTFLRLTYGTRRKIEFSIVDINGVEGESLKSANGGDPYEAQIAEYTLKFKFQ